MVGVGDPAPDFELPGTGGETYRLSDLRGRWVVLAFYPGDFTPVCTRQFCSYRDAADRLDELDAVVLGISPQSVGSHERFRAEYGLTVPLLSDSERIAVHAYGVVRAGLVRRSIFIIDPQGTVRYRHAATLGLRYQDVEHLAAALDDARARLAAA
jgi:thioredoxin-dependent peroxiredoxin